MSTEDVTIAEEPVSKSGGLSNMNLPVNTASKFKSLQKAIYVWNFNKTKQVPSETLERYLNNLYDAVLEMATEIQLERRWKATEDFIRKTVKVGGDGCEHALCMVYYRSWKTLWLKKYYRKRCWYCDYMEDL